MEAWIRVFIDVWMEKRGYIREYLKGKISRMNQILRMKEREVSRIISVILSVTFGEKMVLFADTQKTWGGTYFRGRTWVEIMSLHLDMVSVGFLVSIQLEM